LIKGSYLKNYKKLNNKDITLLNHFESVSFQSYFEESPLLTIRVGLIKINYLSLSTSFGDFVLVY